jgi:hypothetical protein
MDGLRRFLLLNVEAKTGLSSVVASFGVVAVLTAPVAFVLVLLTIFIWLSQRTSSLVAALILAAVFLAVTFTAVGLCILFRQNTIRRARLALSSTTGPVEAVGQNLRGASLRLHRVMREWWLASAAAAGGLAIVGIALAWYRSREPLIEDDAFYDYDYD